MDKIADFLVTGLFDEAFVCEIGGGNDVITDKEKQSVILLLILSRNDRLVEFVFIFIEG